MQAPSGKEKPANSILGLTHLKSVFIRALYEFMYWRGMPRWDTGITPPEVKQLIEVEHLPPGRALDIGCGTGTNVVYLAQHGFAVVGIDFVRRAIDKARDRARAAQINSDLRAVNVLEPLDLGAPFDFALDIGCFHNFDEVGRALYAANLTRWTRPGSTYLLYAFYPASTGGRRFGVTPTTVSDTFEPRFKLASSTVDSRPEQDSAWYRMERIG
jgi:SAM-dependent methyltransferase